MLFSLTKIMHKHTRSYNHRHHMKFDKLATTQSKNEIKIKFLRLTTHNLLLLLIRLFTLHRRQKFTRIYQARIRQ